jgi:hypothetical protein
MKKWMIISLFLLGMLAFSSISFAWFTYVQRKSLVSFVSHEMRVDLTLGDQAFQTTMVLKGLKYVSLENEVFHRDYSDGFNDVGLRRIITINVPLSSPSLKVNIHVEEQYPLIYLFIDEGLNHDQSTWVQDYHHTLHLLYEQGDTHEAFREKVNEHNQSILNHIKTVELKPGQTYYIQWMIWIDIDAFEPQIIDPMITYMIPIRFMTISGKGALEDE